jgi:tripeptidyl-peptidase-2
VRTTAKDISDPFQVGLIQVDKSWEYLHTHYDRVDQDVLFDVRCSNHNNARGLYLREAGEMTRPVHLALKLTPKYMKPTDIQDTDNQRQLDLELRLVLTSSESWVRTPDYLYTGASGRTFDVSVDPTHLEPGKFHFAQVEAFDSLCPDRGPLFRFPITVCKPVECPPSNPTYTLSGLQLSPSVIHRRFVTVPTGATYAGTVNAHVCHGCRVAFQATQAERQLACPLVVPLYPAR